MSLFLSQPGRSLSLSARWRAGAVGAMAVLALLGASLGQAQTVGTAATATMAAPALAAGSSAPTGAGAVGSATSVTNVSQVPVEAAIPADTSSSADAAGEAAVDSAADAIAGNAQPAPDLELPSDFQRFVQIATGKALPIFGTNLFRPGAFGAAQAVQVPDNYLLGPGDEIVLRVTGVLELSERLLVGRDGQVILPKVGAVPVAGVAFKDLPQHLDKSLARVFTNYTLSVNLGRLRSIEVFVVGEARQPGKKVVNSLSTLINAVFETGGPNAKGSMRAIEVRRAGKTLATVDLYGFMAKGDTSGDVPLLNGDIIVIPPVGPQVALVGTVNREAIYELAPPQNTIQEVLGLTGGLPMLAAPQKAQLDRIDPARQPSRFVEDFALDATGLAKPLRGGDILTVFQISPQLANAVTLQGNVAAPMRYTHTPGMRVSDLVANNNFLVPVSYWLRLNAGANVGSYSQPEVNLDYATIQRLDPVTLRTEILAFNLGKALLGNAQENLLLQPGDLVRVYAANDPGPATLTSITLQGEVVGGLRRFAWRAGMTLRDLVPSAQWLVDRYNYWQRPSGNELRNDINWDYAQVIRRVPDTLQTRSFPLNLGQAVLGQRPEHNLLLEPGDTINLFTTMQVPVPLAKRTRLVTLGGEVAVPGVYQVEPGETLPQLLRRAGGLTPQAYVFGTEFTREAVRQQQQRNLDQLVARLEASLQSQGAAQLANLRSEDAARASALLQSQQDSQRQQIARLKTLRSNGRVALEIDPAQNSLAALPALPLEDGDRVVVPAVPSFVAAFGAVNNENVFVYRPGRTVADVYRLAGLSEDAEEGAAFVLRADGTVVANRDASGWFSNLQSVQLMPGDTVVVPQKVDRETGWAAFIRNTKDITQILSNLGLGLAALRSL